MKDCLVCGQPMADLAPRCPNCGMPEGARLAGPGRVLEEPLGFARPKALLWILGALLVFLGWVVLEWFWN